MPDYWVDMEGTGEAGSSNHPFSSLGCLPVFEKECDLSTGDDAKSLRLVVIVRELHPGCPCTIQECACPSTDCCSDADCAYLDPDDTDCNTAICTPENTCALKQGPSTARK